jgi:hypothetical protein
MEAHAPINLKQIRGLWGIGAQPGAARQALAAMESVLIAEGHPAADSPILWDNAQIGDLVGSPETGRNRAIARRLRPEWRAKRLLALYRAVLTPFRGLVWS